MSEDQEPYIHLPSDEELRAKSHAPQTGAPQSVPTTPIYNFGFVGGMSRLLAEHERIGKAMQGVFYEIMFAPGALTRAEREMLAAVAAAAQDCEY